MACEVLRLSFDNTGGHSFIHVLGAPSPHMTKGLNTHNTSVLLERDIMGRKRLDLIGKRVGYLTVIDYFDTKYKTSRWLCYCDCGCFSIVKGSRLKPKAILSCGCIKGYNGAHGESDTKFYNVWLNMKGRCYNKKRRGYKNYGGRGITVCEAWLEDFQAFYNWAMANGYEEHLSIDRIDNDKGYSPDNCRWVTQKEQMNNTRLTTIVTYNGKKYPIQILARKLGIDVGTLRYRLKVGNKIDMPIKRRKYN